jgi:hypothetical protein
MSPTAKHQLLPSKPVNDANVEAGTPSGKDRTKTECDVRQLCEDLRSADSDNAKSGGSVAPPQGSTPPPAAHATEDDEFWAVQPPRPPAIGRWSDCCSTAQPSTTTQSCEQAPPADAAMHVVLTLHGPLPPGAAEGDVAFALLAGVGGCPQALNLRQLVLPCGQVRTGFAVVAIGAATRLAAKQSLPLLVGPHRACLCVCVGPCHDAAFATRTGSPVTALAASNVPKKAGRGRSGLWHVLVSKADAAVLLARHGCLRFVSESEYVCFDTPAEAAACGEAHVSAPVTIELMRSAVPEHVRADRSHSDDATQLPLYVPADPASHVWLAVGQVGFGFAGDQAAVCGMLRAACAPLVTSAAATNGSDDDDDDDGAKESSANQ